MSVSHNYCVILAGGTGSKLWPYSRLEYPKQFHELPPSGRSFFQHTFYRCGTVVPVENIIVVTTSRYHDLVLSQVPGILPENILEEPHHRNTAPAVAYATYTLLKRDPEAVLSIVPSDNVIKNVAAFSADIKSTMAFAAANDAIVAIGIKPDRPDASYGYIQASGGKDALGKGEPLRVKTFTEKPDPEIARVFIDSGEFLWNSGTIAFKASVMKRELDEHMQELSAWFGGWEDAIGTPGEEEFIKKAYAGIQKYSLALGIMEKTSKAWVYPADYDWADVGTWDSLGECLGERDTAGNISPNSNVVMKDSRKNLVFSTNKDKMIAVKGLEDFLIVDSDDVLMICPRTEKDSLDLKSNVFLPKFEKFK